MEKKYRLEPFDIERAKAGEPVCTIDGEDVKILCFDRNNDTYPIVALIGDDETIKTYTKKGKFLISTEGNCKSDLMLKVEVIGPYIYAEVAGEITPFENVKVEGFVDLKSLEYLIIKTHDGKFLKIWKKNLPEEKWEDAQKVASEIGEGWRVPYTTRVY